MTDYCKNFKGGLCEKTNMRVPRSWCIERCQFGKNMHIADKPKPIETRPPTAKQMAIHFGNAMKRWAKSGFKTVSEEEYTRRRKICSACSGGWRCPHCGCVIWAKAALDTEKCPEGKWEAKKTKKYGSIFFRGLNRPIDLTDIYKGQSVFLLVNGPSLNSFDLSLVDKNVTMSVNNGGILKTNLWCGMDTPSKFLDSIWEDPSIMKFTTIGKRDSRYIINGKDSDKTIKDLSNVIFFAAGNDTDPEKWLSQNRITWSVKRGNGHALSVFMASLHILWFLGFKNVYVCGADFKMNNEKPYFFEERKSCGEVNYNNDLFKCINEQCRLLQPHLLANDFNVYNCTKDSGLTAFPYIDYEDAVARSRVKENKDTLGAYEGRKVLKENREIIYYSHNTIDETPLNDACRKSLAESGFPIISVTKKPVDFGRNIVVDLPDSLGSMLQQIIIGLESSTADFVYLAEHDCVYHKSHFELTSNFIAYDKNMWRLSPYGFRKHPDLKPVLSACMGPRLLLLDAIKKKYEHYKVMEKHQEGQGKPYVKMLYEPGRGGGPSGKEIKCALLDAEFPSLDVRHGINSTTPSFGAKNGQIQEIPFWGIASDVRKGLGL